MPSHDVPWPIGSRAPTAILGFSFVSATSDVGTPETKVQERRAGLGIW